MMSNIRKWCMLGCFGLMCVVLASIFVRFTTVHIAVKRLHMDNLLTNAVLFDREDFRRLVNPQKQHEKVNIDWEMLYPFSEGKANKNIQQKTNSSSISGKIIKINIKIEEKKESIEKKISAWTNEYLVGYRSIVEAYNTYKKDISWRVMSIDDYNSVVEIEDGQLAGYEKKNDVSDKIDNIVKFTEFCKENGADFIYVSAPSKIDRHEEKYAKLDFSNANADDFLSGLKNNGVRYIDIRDNIDAEGLTTRNLFFRTDHHWLPETGLWATSIIAKYLNDNGIINSNPSLLNIDNWNKSVIKKCFLGSRGKKITMARTTPDDITILHPKFDINYHMVIPDLNIDMVGDFDITYDHAQLDIIDYYNRSPYHAYAYGDRPLISIDNEDAGNNKKLLMIRISFADVVVPFIATQFGYTDVLDLRHMKGSVHQFIKLTKPDVVVVLYHIEGLDVKVDYTKHDNIWDFR